MMRASARKRHGESRLQDIKKRLTVAAEERADRMHMRTFFTERSGFNGAFASTVREGDILFRRRNEKPAILSCLLSRREKAATTASRVSGLWW